MSDDGEIDVFNKWAIGMRAALRGNLDASGDLVILRPPTTLTRQEAAVFAAWLVALTDDNDQSAFKAAYAAVCRT